MVATSAGSFMSKNIVLLSDGTGNSSAKLFKTNVWRLFQIFDLREPALQIAFYDDGVGTSSFNLDLFPVAVHRVLREQQGVGLCLAEEVAARRMGGALAIPIASSC
jgi:uncharacterized protein (DUF2235 family)